jgi:hypothetical protein
MKEEIHYSIQVPLGAHKNERNGKVPLVVWHFQLKNETTPTAEATNETSNVNFEMSIETLQSLMEKLNGIQNRIDFLQQR